MYPVYEGDTYRQYLISDTRTPKQIKNQRIIISPLNWGMGHLSRCIPLIEQLLQQENTCFLAADQNHLSIAMQYFGKRIEYIQLDPYPFKFNTKGFSQITSAPFFKPKRICESCK